MMVARLIRNLRRGSVLLGIALAFALGTPASIVAGPQYEFRWMHPEQEPPAGPGHSDVIIYVTGRGDAFVPAAAAPPNFVDVLAERFQWDVVTFIRPLEADRNQDDDRILEALRAEVQQLTAQGYRRIVLVGSSRGAWLSLKAARDIAGLHAVVAASPGTYGADAANLHRADAELLAMFGAYRQAPRVGLFLFRDDYVEFGDPPRGPQIAELARNRNLPVLIVDRPADLSGHSSSASGRFTRRYVECIGEFLAAPSVGFSSQCPSGEYARGGDIHFPDVVEPVWIALPEASPLRRFAGRWAGDDPDGGYWIFQAEDLATDRIQWLVGHSPAPTTPDVGTSGQWLDRLAFSVRDGSDQIWGAKDGFRYRLDVGPNGNLHVEVHPANEDQAWDFEIPRRR